MYIYFAGACRILSPYGRDIVVRGCSFPSESRGRWHEVWPVLSDRNLGILSRRLLPFPVIPPLLLFCFPWSRASATGKIVSLLFLHPSLRTPVCSLRLPICPISSGSEDERSRHRAFHFSPAANVTNAFTVIWKSTLGELLLLLLKPSSSSGLFMVMDNDGNFAEGSQSLSSVNPNCTGVRVCTFRSSGELPKLLCKENDSPTCNIDFRSSNGRWGGLVCEQE